MVIISVVLVSIISIIFFLATSSSYGYSRDNKESIIAVYKERLVESEELLLIWEKDASITKERIESLRYNMELWRFFILTNTTERDYLDIRRPLDKIEMYEPTILMLYIFEAMFILSIVLSIILSVYTFGLDITDGTMKNIIGSKEQRNKILFGKLGFQLSINCGIIILLTALACLIGVFKVDASFLVYEFGGFHSINCLVSVLIGAIGLIIVTTIISLVVNCLLVKTKNKLLSISIFGVIAVIIIMTGLLIDNRLITEVNGDLFNSNNLPFFNVHYIGRNYNLATLFWYFGYVVFGGGFMVIVKIVFGKSDF